jgi:hypothetical protein
MAREWFPELAGVSPRRTSWPLIEPHHDRIGQLLPVVPVSVIHQRLQDEGGLAVSVASLRRYVRARFPERSALAELEVWRPPPSTSGSQPTRHTRPGDLRREFSALRIRQSHAAYYATEKPNL